MKIFSTLAIMSLAFSAMAQEDGAFLDAKYTHLVHPKTSRSSLKALPKNDVVSVILNQTRVKSQAARGTCSIFSATAYLEGQLIKARKSDSGIDLSEEWLEYIALRGKTSDGSSAPANFGAFYSYGMAQETTMPYIGEDWTSAYNPLKETRCGHLPEGQLKTACFIVHRDPKLLNMTDTQIISTLKDEEFIASRKEALEFKKDYLVKAPANYYLWDTNQVKETLLKGKPVILEIDFYYGAWNHRKADELGIGRDLDHWAKGIVTGPEAGSVDLEESQKSPAGHSVLVVGYDDNKIIKKTIKMTDGKMKTFTYKGVYYFKNSWGTSSFGANFEVDGQNFPGYGMIVQDHANEAGSFFVLPQ